jgi:hypothetical protein
MAADRQVDRDIDLFLTNYSPEPYEVLATFTDVKSGRYADRPELEKAIGLWVTLKLW